MALVAAAAYVVLWAVGPYLDWVTQPGLRYSPPLVGGLSCCALLHVLAVRGNLPQLRRGNFVVAETLLFVHLEFYLFIWMHS